MTSVLCHSVNTRDRHEDRRREMDAECGGDEGDAEGVGAERTRVEEAQLRQEEKKKSNQRQGRPRDLSIL